MAVAQIPDRSGEAAVVQSTDGRVQRNGSELTLYAANGTSQIMADQEHCGNDGQAGYCKLAGSHADGIATRPGQTRMHTNDQDGWKPQGAAICAVYLQKVATTARISATSPIRARGEFIALLQKMGKPA
jgi:hypothetical protein